MKNVKIQRKHPGRVSLKESGQPVRTVGSARWLAALPGAPLLVEPTRGRDRAGPHATWCPAADTLSRFDLTPAVAEKSHHLERGLMKCQMTESTGPG